MGVASSDSADDAASASSSDVAHERLTRKLAWRCRRGMKELDFLLLRYLKERHATATSDERVAFVEFLELPDPDLVRYLIAGDVPHDPRHAELCRAVRRAE